MYAGLLMFCFVFFTMKKVFEYSQETSVILCRFAFIEFATLADAEEALQSSQNMKFGKREVRVQFNTMQEKSDMAKGMWDCSCSIIHVGVYLSNS